MKLNWAWATTIFFTSFVVFMIFMGYKSFQTNFDLVSDDYYAQELKYQDIIDKKSNESNLEQTVKIEKKNQKMYVVFPENHIKNNYTGTVYFFKPSNKNFDFKFNVSSTLSQPIEVSSENLTSGTYKVYIDWQSNGTFYFKEIPIYY